MQCRKCVGFLRGVSDNQPLEVQSEWIGSTDWSSGMPKASARGTVEELRSAAQQGVTDAALLNRATAAELEATRAARASDAAEAHAVLARLEPLLNQANLAEGEVE